MKKMLWLLRTLLDRTLGALYGHRCDLCREWTTYRVDDAQGTVTWCPICFNEELRRHGLWKGIRVEERES
jgi:hypothetical protein